MRKTFSLRCSFYDAWLRRKVNEHTREIERPALKENPKFPQWATFFNRVMTDKDLVVMKLLKSKGGT